MDRTPFHFPNFADFINERFDEHFENIYDQFISMPLTSIPRNPERQRVLTLHQSISTRIHSIRRLLELNEMDQTHFPVTQQMPIWPTNNENLTVFTNYMHLLLDAEQLLGINPETMEDVKVTLTDEEFAKLETKPWSEDTQNTDTQCNVCLEHYAPGNSVTKLPCNHYFHTECIRSWLCGEKINCPMCRHDIRESVDN